MTSRCDCGTRTPLAHPCAPPSAPPFTLHTPAPQVDALRTIWASEGHRGLYRGWAANTLKVVPQNAIRLVSYEALKKLLGVARAKTDT